MRKRFDTKRAYTYTVSYVNFSTKAYEISYSWSSYQKNITKCRNAENFSFSHPDFTVGSRFALDQPAYKLHMLGHGLTVEEG